MGRADKPAVGLVLEALRELNETQHKKIVWGSAKKGWRVGPVRTVDAAAVRQMIKEGWVKQEGDRVTHDNDRIERYSLTPAGRRAFIAATRDE
jgi:hypothetical protein